MPFNIFAERPVPPDTLRAARESFGSNSFYIAIGDHLTQMLALEDQKLLSGSRTINRSSRLSVLSMITIFQYIEGLTDYQAIEAARTRTDWKYALHLPLNCPSFAPYRLCRERNRLRNQVGSHKVFQNLVAHVADINNHGCKADLQVEAQTLVQTVCRLCRLGVVVEAMQLVLEALASHHSEWLRKIALPHWYERYNPAMNWEKKFNYGDLASGAEIIGADMCYLLERIEQYGIPAMLACEEVQDLESVYNQQYENDGGRISWRTACCATCGTAGLYRD